MKKILSIFLILTMLLCASVNIGAQQELCFKMNFETSEGAAVEAISGNRVDVLSSNRTAAVTFGMNPKISSAYKSNGESSLKVTPSQGGEGNQIYIKPGVFENVDLTEKNIKLTFDFMAEKSSSECELVLYNGQDKEIKRISFAPSVGNFDAFSCTIEGGSQLKYGIKDIMIYKMSKGVSYYLDNFSCSVIGEEKPDIAFKNAKTYKKIGESLAEDNLSAVSAGDECVYNIDKIENNLTEKSAELLQAIAVYSDKKLVNVDSKHISIEPGSFEENCRVSVVVPGDAKNCKVNTFLFDAANLKPLLTLAQEPAGTLTPGGNMETNSLAYVNYSGNETISYTTDESYSGLRSMKIVPRGSFPGMLTNVIDVEPGKVYNYSMAVKPDDSVVTSRNRYIKLQGFVFYDRYNSSGKYVDTKNALLFETPCPLTEGWFKLSKNYTISDSEYNIGNVKFGFYMHHDGVYYGTYYVDDIEITPGEKEEITSNTGKLRFSEEEIEKLSKKAADYKEYKKYEETVTLVDGDAPTINLDDYKPDYSRIAAALKKAKNIEEKALRGETLGEDDILTVGAIGGSITAGAGASENKYFYNTQVAKWWQDTFPHVPIKCINAGVGGTPSYLGVHRAYNDLIRYSPDFIMIEFAVNDGNTLSGLKSYEALVRECVNMDTDRDGTVDKYPGVMLLYNTRENGSSAQNVHAYAGKRYGLPMCSLRNALYPEISKDRTLWRELYADIIHPNNMGHYLLARFVTYQLDEILNNPDNIVINEKPVDNGTTLESEGYFNADIYVPKNSTVKSVTGWEESTQNYHDWNLLYGYEGINVFNKPGINSTWLAKSGTNSSIEIEVEGTDIAIVFEAWHEKAKVYVDGAECGTVDSSGYNNSANYYIAAKNLKKGKHIVKVENVNQGKFRLMGILTSDAAK